MSYTPDPRLVFKAPPSASGRLVFGEAPVAPPVSATAAVRLPKLRVAAYAGRVGASDRVASAQVRLPRLRIGVVASSVNSARVAVRLPKLRMGVTLGAPREAQAAVRLPKLRVGVTADYDINVQRPLAAHGTHRHQVATPTLTPTLLRHDVALPSPAGWNAPHASGTPVGSPVTLRHQHALGQRSSAQAPHAEGDDARTGWRAAHQHALGQRSSAQAPHAEGDDVRTGWIAGSQDGIRRRTSARAPHAEAVPLRSWRQAGHQVGIRVLLSEHHPYQEARRPPGGRYQPPEPPVDRRCYVPNARLVFWDRDQGDGRLAFICERFPHKSGTVTVPVLVEYIVTNEVILTRVADARVIPLDGASMQLDRNSWTWGFGVNLPGSSLSLFDRGEPLELLVNSVPYRFRAEKPRRTRTFASDRATLSGRGLGAELAAPECPRFTFSQPTDRTAQQLMADVLTDNGVSIGWGVDFGLTDWLVPAGCFSLQGSRIDALNAIAGAAGGYLQPHDTAKTLRVLPAYPVAPWEWGTATPDLVLPSSVVTVEGSDWQKKAAYNRVFLAGTNSSGILADITRSGQPWDQPAPMVTDQLMTAPEVARQRGLAILGDTGEQAMVTLTLPVLPATGVVKPGTLLRYTDGTATQMGLVRAVSVGMRFPEIWQTLEVETHV